MIYILLIISFILDEVISLLVSTNSLLLPLCSLVTIVLIYPLIRNEKKRYFIILGILGFLYDVGYGDVYLLNVILFLLMGLVTMLLNYYLPNNYLTSVLEVIISVIVYRILGYLFYMILNLDGFNFIMLWESIYRSLIINMLYGFIIYFIVDKNTIKYEISSKK